MLAIPAKQFFKLLNNLFNLTQVSFFYPPYLSLVFLVQTFFFSLLQFQIFRYLKGFILCLILFELIYFRSNSPSAATKIFLIVIY